VKVEQSRAQTGRKGIESEKGKEKKGKEKRTPEEKKGFTRNENKSIQSIQSIF